MLILLRYRLSENYLTFEFQNRFINYHTFQEVENFSKQIMQYVKGVVSFHNVTALSVT